MSQPDASRPPTATKRHPLYRLLRDVYYGAIYGDFSPPGLGTAAIATRIALGYVPLVGTLCAMRDYFANRQRGSRLGAVLCLLAIFPVLGGFPLTAEIVRNVRVVRLANRMHKQLGTTAGYQPALATSSGASQPALPTRTKRNIIARVSIFLAALVPVVVVVLWSIFVSVATPLLAPRKLNPLLPLLGFSLLVPLLTIVLGEIGWGRAKHTVPKRAYKKSAVAGVFIGWSYLVLTVVIAGIFLLLYHFNPTR